jgi:hypothetical protein
MSDSASLAIYSHRNGWMIGWYFADEGDFGAMLGEGGAAEYIKTPPAAYDPVNDGWIAEHAIYRTTRDLGTGRGFVFPSERSAKTALAIARRAIADARKNRTPEPWEALALAAGWTPPKRRPG